MGHIAQAAVLPAFRHARRSELAALISDTPEKLRALSRRYGVRRCHHYDEYEACLAAGDIDAVYIALPNDLHAEFAVRALQMGVHVLCEKPMALSSSECGRMIEAAQQNGLRLMIAYRLHFDPANLEVIRLVERGRIGEPRVFNSTFTMPVREGNIRVQARHGGGPLYDIGLYCINAARYLFRDEPLEVTALAATSGKKTFREIEESVSVTLRFPRERLATFIISFGAASTGWYQIVGTRGDICLEMAYDYVEPRELQLTVEEKTRTRAFPKLDQFAPELEYFSGCILKHIEPEPSGLEGLADIRVIEAIREALERGTTVPVEAVAKRRRPTAAQRLRKPAVREPRLVAVAPPSKKAA